MAKNLTRILILAITVVLCNLGAAAAFADEPIVVEYELLPIADLVDIVVGQNQQDDPSLSDPIVVEKIIEIAVTPADLVALLPGSVGDSARPSTIRDLATGQIIRA